LKNLEKETQKFSFEETEQTFMVLFFSFLVEMKKKIFFEML
jgi:hypothetical protein